MKLRFFLVFWLAVFFAKAQTPQVPTRMEFAGIKLRIHESGRKDIQESVDALTRSKTHYEAMAEKARSYFPIIERIFREENVPDDFKYLALQESALIPDAVSSSNAVGYWQFKDFTGIEMGLRIDKSIDERMNIVAASRAAAKYFKLNNTYFDNWLHALQAYQMGAGGAMRVLDEATGVKSMTIDKKTYWYVKKYLAHKVAYEGMTDQEPKLKLSEYTDGAGKTLREIAREVNVSEEELAAYNKWLKRGRIPSDKNYVVIIPATEYLARPKEDRIIAKKSAQSNAIEEPNVVYTFTNKDLFPLIEKEKDGFARINHLPGLIAHQGDKVTDLAVKGGVPLSRFLKYNDIGIDHQVTEGEIFYLKKKRAKARTYYHILQYDETLWEVSQKYGLRLSKLKTKNRIRENDQELKPGYVLWLRYIRPGRIPVEYREVEKPEEKEKIVVASKSTKEEVVVEKDTVQIKPEEVTLDKDSIMVEPKEENIEIDRDTSEIVTIAQVRDSIKRIHEVAPGETYYAISKQYNTNVMDVLEWNNLNIHDKLAIGQKLIVYEYPKNIQTNAQQKSTPFIYYTVQPGDTFYKIARNHEITVEELMELNDKKDFSLNMGEKIIVGKKISSN